MGVESKKIEGETTLLDKQHPSSDFMFNSDFGRATCIHCLEEIECNSGDPAMEPRLAAHIKSGCAHDTRGQIEVGKSRSAVEAQSDESGPESPDSNGAI